MKILIASLVTLFTVAASAADKNQTLNFSFRDGDVTDVIKEYAKASGERFIVDPSVRGKITILNPAPVSVAEAFNQLSSALAVNGIAISHQGDEMVVSPARITQRSLIEVGNQLPALKPERMYTWTIQLKYVSADEVNKQLRILTSKDGELVPFSHTNQILVTDWVSNLHRIAKIIAEVDRPAGKTAKK